MLIDTLIDWGSGPITWIERSALSKPCKQAITAEPFLPYNVQIQVELPSTTSFSGPQATPLTTWRDLCNGQRH